MITVTCVVDYCCHSYPLVVFATTLSLSLCVPFVCLSVWLFSSRLSVCLSVLLSVCLSFHLSACLPTCLFVCLSACLSVCLSVCLSACLPLCLPACLVLPDHVSTSMLVRLPWYLLVYCIPKRSDKLRNS